MNDTYFTDRERGPRPRTVAEIDARVWSGLRRQVEARITDGSFGVSFPEACPDGGAVIGADRSAFYDALAAEVPELDWPCRHERDWLSQQDHPESPPTDAVLDALEFVYHHVADPEVFGKHSFFRHNHLQFDRAAGRARWREDANRILARNGIEFEMTEAGRVQRLGPPILGERLRSAVFATGNPDLDRLLESARTAFLDRRPGADRTAVEHVWDAFEQAKTLMASDVKVGIGRLLDSAAGSNVELRERLERDASELTEIGNRFGIRHHRAGQAPVHTRREREYLFGRLYNLLEFILPRHD